MAAPLEPAQFLPPALLQGFNVAARQLYGPHRRGWVSALFKTWESSAPQPHQMLVPMEFSEMNLRARDAWAVTLILEGEARLMPPLEQDTAPAGTLVWFQVDGGRIPFEPSPRLRECSFAMEVQTARRLEEVGLLRFVSRVQRQPPSARLILEYLDIFEALQEATASTERILRKVMMFLERLEPPEAPSIGADWVRRACQLLEQNVEPAFTMREAARILGVDYREFRRRFRARIGCSPMEYQMEARMRLARQWLPRRSVKETAHLLGYDDPFLFSRQFKRTIGLPPSAFRPGPQKGR